jgi:hypothetical protein
MCLLGYGSQNPSKISCEHSQTRIHIVPIGGARTWETKGSQHVKVYGMEYQHQVTMAISSCTNGQCLPFQVNFQGNTSCKLPPLNVGQIACVKIMANISPLVTIIGLPWKLAKNL